MGVPFELRFKGRLGKTGGNSVLGIGLVRVSESGSWLGHTASKHAGGGSLLSLSSLGEDRSRFSISSNNSRYRSQSSSRVRFTNPKGAIGATKEGQVMLDMSSCCDARYAAAWRRMRSDILRCVGGCVASESDS